MHLRLPGEFGCGIDVARAGSPLEGGQVHLQPHEALLRAVVDVALQPTQPGALGLDGRAAGVRFGSRLRGQLVAAPAPEQPVRDHMVDSREAAHRPGQRDREEDARDQVQDDLDGPAGPSSEQPRQCRGDVLAPLAAVSREG